jgi:hypothetical protein
MTATTTPTVISTTSAPKPPQRSGGRGVLLVLGALLVFFGVNTLIGGALVTAFDSRHDDDGYFNAKPGRFSTGTHAITSASLDLSATGPDELYTQDLLGRLRLSVDSTTAAPVFIGIARTDDVTAYLGNVAHEEVDETDLGLFGVVYTAKPGGAPAAPPTAQTFWVASAVGDGTQTVTWTVQPGDWTVVVMNADGSAGVSADGTGGVSLPILHTAMTVTFVTGGVLLLAGLALLAGARISGRRQPSA